jgi:hypothetical protein
MAALTAVFYPKYETCMPKDVFLRFSMAGRIRTARKAWRYISPEEGMYGQIAWGRKAALVTAAAALALVLAAVEAPAFRLPATGITTCYDDTGVIDCPAEGEDFYGQDGTYLKGTAMAHQDNGDGTVTDLATGLMWQKVPETSALAWADAADTCAASNLANHGDWRLPSMQELLSLVAWAKSPSPYLSSVFSDGHGDYWQTMYWSGDTVASNDARAWCFDYSNASSSYTEDKTDPYGARCVRGTGIKP